MMTSINGIVASTVITVLCLLPLAMMGDGQANPEAQIGVNVSGPPLMFPDAPVDVYDRNLDDVLKIYSPFVLDCWELGCRPCMLIDPKINQIAEDFEGRIAFGKLCIDYNPITLSKYGISRTPTLLIFNNSTLVYKHVGNYPKDELKHIILTVLHMQ